MENSHRFFENRECKYYPCHNMVSPCNCLFCYCPLYHLGDKCGGSFKYYKEIKSCVNCHLPHLPEYYDTITAKLKNAPKHTPAKEASND